MFSGSKKPYSAVTVQIERLTSEQYEVNDASGVVDLIEVIRLQSSGPTEASRALRKKLKYGNVHRQLRALTILDFLIQNAGERFLRGFADEPLLERLRFAATDPVSDPEVKDKCKQLFAQWSVAYKDVNGMGRVAALYKQLPQRKKPAQKQQSKVIRETEQPDERIGHSISVSTGDGPSTVLSGPGASSSKANSGSKLMGKSKHKKTRSKAFNLEREKPEILQTIASSSVASTNLMNALKLVNRESHRVSEDPEVLNRFELCKQLRRQILRYIQHVESEDFLGGLIHANEELITALMAFEVLDKSVDYDSDSEGEEPSSPTGGYRGFNDDFAGLVLDGPEKPPRPERPTSISLPRSSPHGKEPALESESEESELDDDDDDDNPFGDKNAVITPAVERQQPTWREV
ncbi:putative actin patch assembly and actin polymerization protein [Arachnomyces sp. PD_36]|nr:putative actin patch assembly and actin polymerization protein [Arachnomyces sp. PD_36]